ncbi:biliverdin-producing heme oxygenase [Mucilaginibacter sp. PAMB04274]|uniref:biliverdin-producing heme oxygenase n=1 Tax=Mucilaginibacter sp. PAMB04274 TaxID=3138568 RepID=UPI0031F6AB68
MLSELLKEHTLTNHQQLEKMLVQRMKAIRSTDGYIDLLQLFYTYFGGLEQEIDRYITATELPDYQQRRKSAALANDITALGGTPQAKAFGTALPTIQNTTQAYGALYVIEGSTLGGKIISKMMAQQLDIKDSTGLSFFNSYGDNTELMWDTFKQTLNNRVKSEGEAAEVIESANQTFGKFKEWAAR